MALGSAGGSVAARSLVRFGSSGDWSDPKQGKNNLLTEISVTNQVHPSWDREVPSAFNRNCKQRSEDFLRIILGVTC